MNLYLRFLWLLICSTLKPKITDLLAPCVLRYRVLPNDLDLNLHMNNGRYLSVMDLGRFDLIYRSGIFSQMLKEKAIPVLSAAQVRYRLQLHFWEPYDMETRIICWDDKWVYLQQRFIVVKGKRAGETAAIALFKGAFYSRAEKTTVPTSKLLKKIGFEAQSPEFPNFVTEWIRAEDSFRDHGRAL
jgi:acyl-CoA thioesterase FadM